MKSLVINVLGNQLRRLDEDVGTINVELTAEDLLEIDKTPEQVKVERHVARKRLKNDLVINAKHG